MLACDRELDATALVDVTLRPSTDRDASDATQGEFVVTSPRAVVLARSFEDRCEAVVDALALVLAAAHALERERELGREVARSSELREPDPASA